VTEAALLAKALSDPNRLWILSEIASRKELFVGELGACRVISNASVSHHLRVLTQAGLITFRRSGKQLFYRLVSTRLVEYSRFVSTLSETGSNGLG